MISSRTARVLKALKITVKTVWWCLVVMLVLLLINILASKLTGKVPSVFGYSVMNIVSGSMEDEIPKGSYILIKKTAPEDVSEGDIICFYSTDPTIYGMPNTHRVVEKHFDGEEYSFVTKGDANSVNDTQLADGGRLIGKYVTTLDALTSFSDALSGNVLVIIIIFLQICIFSMFAYSFVISNKEKKNNGSGK